MRRWIAAAISFLLAACAGESTPLAEGDFAVLARAEEGFAQARPGHALQFPRDHGAHPDFRIEWWYLTANLQDAAGRDYGVQWTLFRTAIAAPGERTGANPWQDAQAYMAHFALTTPDGHVAFQRYARAGKHADIAQAGVTAAPFAAWLDDWELRSTGDGWLPLRLQAAQHPYAARLTLSSDRPPVLQGDGGFSQKHPQGGGSHYYSQPFLAAEGELVVDGERLAVSGEAWLDREWSSQFLQPDQSGWDWFALHLESGEKLMLYRLRQRAGSIEDRGHLYAVLVAADGTKSVLDPAQVGLEALGTERVAGRELPLAWRIRLPEIGRDMAVRALHPQQWMDVDFAYWEGVVRVSGEGPGNRGRGYLELTGYPRP